MSALATSRGRSFMSSGGQKFRKERSSEFSSGRREEFIIQSSGVQESGEGKFRSSGGKHSS